MFLAAQEDGVDPFEDAKSMALNPFVNDHTARLAELVACPDFRWANTDNRGHPQGRCQGTPANPWMSSIAVPTGELLSLALLVVQCSERPIVRLARHKLRC